jgi:hypothetical protein
VYIHQASSKQARHCHLCPSKNGLQPPGHFESVHEKNGVFDEGLELRFSFSCFLP